MKQNTKREKILKVSEKLFEKYGYKGVSVDRIVAKVGIAKGSFYLYFPSKDALYESILFEYLREAHTRMRYVSATDSNLQNRLYRKFVGKLYFLSKKPILREIILGNTEYFSETITADRFYEINKDMTKKLLENAEGELPKGMTLEKIIELDTLFSFLLHSFKDVHEQDFWKSINSIGEILIKGVFSESDWKAPCVKTLYDCMNDHIISSK